MLSVIFMIRRYIKCSSLYCPQQFLPTWLAPNLITFTGFMFLVLNFAMLAFYDFDFTASGRSPLLAVSPRDVYFIMSYKLL